MTLFNCPECDSPEIKFTKRTTKFIHKPGQLIKRSFDRYKCKECGHKWKANFTDDKKGLK